MRKEFAILFLIIFVCSLFSFAIAQTDNVSNGSTSGGVPSVGDLKNVVNASDVSGAKEKTNAVLEKEVPIPEGLRFFASFLLGFGQEANTTEKITLSYFIILAALWIFCLILLLNVLDATGIFQNKSLLFLGAFAITAILGVTGALRESTIFLYDITSIFRVDNGIEIIKVILAVVGAGIILFVAVKGAHMLKKSSKLQEERVSGVKTGVAAGELQNRARTFSGGSI